VRSYWAKVQRYIWFGTLAVAFSVASYRLSGWTSGFLSNLGAGFVGSLLTVFLVERGIEKARERDAARIKRAAFDRLRPALVDHVRFLFNHHKACALKEPNKKPMDIPEIFSEGYYECARLLDFNQPGPTVPRAPWAHYAAYHGSMFLNALERVSDVYIMYLDPASVEALEALRSHEILNLFTTARETLAFMSFRDLPEIMPPQKMPQQWLMNLRTLFPAYVGHLLTLVSLFDKYGTKPITIPDIEPMWRNDVAPYLGSARGPLPPVITQPDAAV
jgi:hypothetical protein